jgi:hypothetical protein
MSAILHWMRGRSHTESAGSDANAEAVIVPPMRQLEPEELELRNLLLEAAEEWRRRLSADAYHALICAIYNSAVIGIYWPASAVEPVLELNHFPGTEGYCARPDYEFRMTAWTWESWHTGVLEGEYLHVR